MSAEPTMANNAEDIENNMVSMKECITIALTLCVSVCVDVLGNDWQTVFSVCNPKFVCPLGDETDIRL